MARSSGCRTIPEGDNAFTVELMPGEEKDVYSSDTPLHGSRANLGDRRIGPHLAAIRKRRFLARARNGRRRHPCLFVAGNGDGDLQHAVRGPPEKFPQSPERE